MSNDGKRIATLNFNYCSYNYPEVMGIKIIEGSTLKKQDDLLVNEELVRLMKWTDGAVGKTECYTGYDCRCLPGCPQL